MHCIGAIHGSVPAQTGKIVQTAILQSAQFWPIRTGTRVQRTIIHFGSLRRIEAPACVMTCARTIE